MKASYTWLRSLVPGLDASAEEAGERLTRAGLELEELIEFGAASPHCVVAEVKKVDKHPKSDKLTLVTVDRGGAEQTVVCGAPNVPSPGGKVVLAPLGVHLPEVGFTIEPRKIAGVVSEGMLCSEQELGLGGGGGKGDGIMVFPERFEAAAGTPLSEALAGSHDFVLDIGVTPNRPDALGHVGIARELAALFELPFEAPEADAPARVAQGKRIEQLASVEIADTERCPHYGAAVVLDIEVGPSPSWLRYRLESLGIRAISNVVDVTNLVLLEFGQPMHAFDLDKLPGGKILVRRARDGEKIVTLDDQERTLVADDLLITDGERPIALAGVMGGANTEIGEGAKGVLLECAYFMPRGVRRTARRHGVHSESSHRFERGTDPHGVPTVLAHAASLVTKLANGQAVPGTILAGVAPKPRREIPLRKKKMVSLLGLDIPMDRATTILERLGCDVGRSSESPDELTVTAPSFRPDLGREEDVIEEVMRVNGIDDVPATPRAVVPKTGRSRPDTRGLAREAAAQLGLSEALTYGFVAPWELEALGAPAACVRLKNPLTEERSVMRTSLLPGLLDALKRARRHGVSDVRLFTVGRTFVPALEGPLPLERLGLAAVLAGERQNGLDKPQPLDVYDAKGLAEELVSRITKRQVTVRGADRAVAPHLHPRGLGELVVDDRRVGVFGPLHPDVVDRFDLDGPALAIELDLGAIEGLGRVVPQFRPIPVLPAVSRDLALLVDETVIAGDLETTIRSAAGELCESVQLFDRFSGKGVPDGRVSLAYHLVFRDPKAATDPDAARTLTDQEVDAPFAQVVAAVSERHGAQVRGA
ncbi:MAG: phenylalanine--tRNA ligase subunit beta [Polyangiaceae bacterium]